MFGPPGQVCAMARKREASEMETEEDSRRFGIRCGLWRKVLVLSSLFANTTICSAGELCLFVSYLFDDDYARCW